MMLVVAGVRGCLLQNAVQMVYRPVITRSHPANPQIATDVSRRTQSENNGAEDDDRQQDCCEVAKDAHVVPPSVFGRYHPNSAEATTLSELMGFGRA